MIRLVRLNGQEIVINEMQIEYIEAIPESKIVMMNGKYHIVRESLQEITEKAAAYHADICSRADGR